MNREEYNRLMDQVSPAPELVCRTRERVRLEAEKQRKERQKHQSLFHFYRRTLATAAAVLIIGCNISPAFGETLAKVPLLGQAVELVTVRNWFSQQGGHQTTVREPALSGEDASWTIDVNEEIQSTVDRYLSEANQRLEAYKQAVLATGGSEEEFDSRNFQVSVDYDIKCQNDQYLSYVLYGRESWTGAYQVTQFYNLDVTTGKAITLKDLLGENWQEIADQAVSRQIAQRDPDGTIYFPADQGGFSGVTEDTSFYLDENGKPVLYFEPYTIAPGGLGPQTFPIEE